MDCVSNPERVFVGRKRLLGEILHAEVRGKSVRIHDLVGAYGSGKSELLHQARLCGDERGRFNTVLVDLGHQDLGYTRQAEPGSTPTEAWRNVDTLQRLGCNVVTQLHEDENQLRGFLDSAGRLTRAARNIKFGEVHVLNQLFVGESAKVSKSPQQIDISYDPQSMQVEKIREAGRKLAALIARFINAASQSKPTLLLVDNVHRVAQREVGSWAFDVIKDLERAVVVLAREPGTALFIPPGYAERVSMPPLDADEVSDYLALRTGRQEPRDFVEDVTDFTGGLPVAVELLVDLHEDDMTEFNAYDLGGGRARLSSDPQQRLAKLVADIIGRIEDGNPLGKALQAASIPMDFDDELFRALLAGLEVPPSEAPRLMSELETFSFISQQDAEAGRRSYMQVHPFLRPGLQEHMKKYESVASGELHALAAAHYFSDFIHSKSYGEMYVYEQPHHQERFRRWLYHLAHSEDWTAIVRQSTFVFLDAFWWWGNYVQFAFCEHLARDLKVIAYEKDVVQLRDFAAAVNDLLEAYPSRAKLRQDFSPTDSSGSWDKVRDALLEIQDLCGVAGHNPDASQEDLLHVAALLEIFLAHADRYEPGGDTDEATYHYRRAETMLARLEEWSDVSWIQFEMADLNLECNKRKAALDGVRRAERTFYELGIDYSAEDEELIANMHRLKADCLWSANEFDHAAKEYGVAVMHSYLFHGVSGSPDDYTMQFYFEMRGRAAARLLQLWKEGPRDAAVRVACLMHEAFSRTDALPASSPETLLRMFESGDLVALAHSLFPRGPELAELGQSRSEFMRDLRKIRGRARRDLRRDASGAI